MRGAGGTIHGRICRADVDYEVQHRGDHVQVTGVIFESEGLHPVSLRIEDRDGRRRITGTLA